MKTKIQETAYLGFVTFAVTFFSLAVADLLVEDYGWSIINVIWVFALVGVLLLRRRAYPVREPDETKIREMKL